MSLTKKLLLSLFLISVFFLSFPFKSKAIIDCIGSKYGGECIKLYKSCSSGRDPQNNFDIGIGAHGCGITEKCCVRGSIKCTEKTNGIGSCKSISDCPSTDPRASVFNDACKSENSATPICCVMNETACNSKGGSCKNTCDTATEIPSTDIGLNQGCTQSGKGSTCCIKTNDPLECRQSGGTCVGTECSATKGEQKVDDKGACEKVDTSKPFCCKSANSSSEQTSDPSSPTSTDPSGTSATTSQPYNYINPLSVTSFTKLFFSVLAGIQGFVGWLAVIFIVIGGVMYIVSAGTGLTNTAKATITYALIGFALAVAAPTLVKEIWSLGSAGAAGGSASLEGNSVQKILLNVLNLLLSLVGILAMIGFVVSGVMYVTAAGSSRADSAKKSALYSIIAVALSGSAIILIRQVVALVNGQN